MILFIHPNNFWRVGKPHGFRKKMLRTLGNALKGAPQAPGFVELLHDGVCGAEFLKQSQAPLCYHRQINVCLQIMNVIARRG
jgi:hypothetical protein